MSQLGFLVDGSNLSQVGKAPANVAMFVLTIKLIGLVGVFPTPWWKLGSLRLLILVTSLFLLSNESASIVSYCFCKS